MDIQKKLHAIANKRQIVLWGLDADATEADRMKAKKAFDDTTELLNGIAGMTSNITSEIVEEDGAPILKYDIKED